MMKYNFRDITPSPDHPRVAGICGCDAYEHVAKRLQIPRVREFVNSWSERVGEPFFGITTNGERVPDLYGLNDEQAPTERMVAAARHLLSVLTGDETALVRNNVVSENWRRWSNPELYVNRLGLRLDECRPEVTKAVLDVLSASLSDRGFVKARNCMRMNQFLGQVVDAPKVMNEYSYNFQLFGEPSLNDPWGWNFYGHHLCLNCLVLRRQMVISPTFMGAEPNFIDEGPWRGLTIFTDEERTALDLMRSLPAEARNAAQIYKLMKDPMMPDWRWHPADQRHLGGAFQDNRIIPYEGVPVSEFTPAQKQKLLDVVKEFMVYLPAGPLAARMEEIERRLPETRFAWIGGYGDDDPFYYRIQSPVVMVEFDHHSGVFLTNEEPWKCHVHTVVRTPNGNDYGKDLLHQHYESVHPGYLPGGRAVS